MNCDREHFGENDFILAWTVASIWWIENLRFLAHPVILFIFMAACVADADIIFLPCGFFVFIFLS